MKIIKDKLKKWYVLYTLIAFVVVFAVGLVNIWYCSVFEAQTDNINEYVRENVVETIKEFYNRIYALSINMSEQNLISDISEYSNEREFYSSKKVLSIVSQLDSYKKTFTDIDLIYLYMAKADMVISAGGVYNSRDFYDIYCSNKVSDYDKWYARISSLENEELFDCDEYIQYNIMLNRIYPVISGDVSCGVIFKKDSIFPNIPWIEWVNKCNIYIYDINNRLSIYDESIDVNELGNRPDFSNLNALSGKYDVITCSIGSQYTAAIVFEKNLDIKTVKKMQVVSLAAIIFNIIIGIIILCYLYVTKVRPLQILANLLNVDIDRISYKFLEEPIRGLIDENNNLSARLCDKNNSVCNLILGKLLIGEISKEYLDILASYRIVFDKKSFVIVIFNLYKEDDISEEGNEHIIDGIINFTHEVLNDENTNAYLTQMQSRIVCICNTDDESENCVRIIAQKVAYITNMLNDKYDFVATVAISEQNDGVEGISHGYLQGLAVINKSELFDHNKVVLYSDVKRISLDNKVSVDESEIVNAVKVGNVDEACAIVDKMLSGIDRSNAQLYCRTSVGVIYTLIKTADMVFGKDASLYELTAALRNYSNIDRVKEICIKSVKEQSEYMRERLNNKNESFVEYIKKYIEDNYSNPDISNESLSELVHYSTIHINNLFKKSYNTTPMVYLTNYRLAMAKKFIVDGMKIADVAEKVGYKSIRTFNRAFQNNFDMSPVEYKRYAINNNID